MYTEQNRKLPNLFLATEPRGQATPATPRNLYNEADATHDFLIVMPLRDFATIHPDGCDRADQP